MKFNARNHGARASSGVPTPADPTANVPAANIPAPGIPAPGIPAPVTPVSANAAVDPVVNATLKAQEIKMIAMNFLQVMAMEIELLKTRQIAELSTLQDEKVAISELYRGHVADIATNPTIFDALEPAARGELKRLAAQLEATARENTNRVRSALDLNTKLMERIAFAAQQNTPMASGYTNTGARRSAAPHRGYAQAPVTLNQQF